MLETKRYNRIVNNMYSSMVRTKCADLFLSWDATSKLLEYKCLICEKWFDLQVEEIAQHLLNCVRQMISSSHQPDNGLAGTMFFHDLILTIYVLVIFLMFSQKLMMRMWKTVSI